MLLNLERGKTDCKTIMFNWCEPFAHEWMFEKPFIKGHGDKFIWIFYYNSFNNALKCVLKIFQPI